MNESKIMLLSREFEYMHNDNIEGSMGEQRIFSEVFFGSDGSRRKGFTLSGTNNIDCGFIGPTDISLWTNSGKSTLTSQDVYAKENFVGKPALESLSEGLTLSTKSKHGVKLSDEDLPDAKPCLRDDLIFQASSGGTVLVTSQENSRSYCHTLIYRLVESSSQGVTSCIYKLKSPGYSDKGCEISGRGSSVNKISTLDHNDQKVSANRAVTSPISQESYVSKLLVSDSPVYIANKSATQRPNKPKWKDACFVKLDDEELARPKDIKNDPRPLLRYHINRLLRAAGWVIGRRKRNSKYKGIGEYVYKSPGGRPIREFHRAWCMCGGSLLTDAISFMQTSECMQWADMAELWSDLSRTINEIEDKLNVLENTSSMALLWCLLDPYANVVFIEKTIRLLKGGIVVKAKRSSVIRTDTGSTTKYRKISRSERDSTDSRSMQDWRCDDTHQFDGHLFDVPIISGEPQWLEGFESSSPWQERHLTFTHFDQTKNDEEGSFCYTRKAHKKSRKISEMKLNGNLAVGEISTARCGSKKSKACCLNDNDLIISAIIKTKTCRATDKWTARKPELQRKHKAPKGSCRLLPRSLKAKHIMEGKWSAVGSRTVLSWLIHSGIVSLNDVIEYRNLKDDAVIKDGLITRDGILCKCCNEVLSISKFKSHAGFKLDRPCVNLFMESGKPFILCQLEAWSAEYKARKVNPPACQVDEIDQNDDSCGRCGDVGELICCDNCPSAFHQACLFEQELPEGNWYCPQCRCKICGDAVNGKEAPKLEGDQKCAQCEDKYHGTCLQQEGIEVGLAFGNWFCGESCRQVYTGLQSYIGLKNPLPDGFSWTLLRCIPSDQKVHSAQRGVALKAECNSKLAVAITIMEECFLPMVDLKTGVDMIPQVIYNWGSQLARLNYKQFYTVVLEKEDILLSAASIRIHGVKVAELPLVATCSKTRRQGMCRRLMDSIEEMLKGLKVEKLVISAIPTLVDTWTVGFGFQALEEEEKATLSKVNLMVFPGSVWLKKELCGSRDNTEIGENPEMSDDNTEAGKNPEIASDNTETGAKPEVCGNPSTIVCLNGLLEQLEPKKPEVCEYPDTVVYLNKVSEQRELKEPKVCDTGIRLDGLSEQVERKKAEAWDSPNSVGCVNGLAEQHELVSSSQPQILVCQSCHDYEFHHL